MKFSFFIFLFTYPAIAFFQNSAIKTEEKEHDYGQVENVYKLQSDFVLKNESSRNLYLMRADVPKDIKVWTSKKTIPPGDTVAVQIYYQPQEEGKFSFPVKLITSADAEPFVLKIKGEVKSIKKDDKTACFYFKKPKPINHPQNPTPIVVASRYSNGDSLFRKKPDYSDLLAEAESLKVAPTTTTTTKDPDPTKPLPVASGSLLTPEQYKPNNIIFLIDVSGSMIDSTKLRWLKLSMKKLIKNVRDEDKITLITYRDSVRCLAEGYGAKDKRRLMEIVDSLKAKGLTRGNKAIHYSLDLALKNYIADGNNQVILATDGEFSFKDHDYKAWTEKVGDKNIVLSTVAFGKDPKAMTNLKDIAKKGKGSFIHVKSRQLAESAVFDEIELRSRKQI